MTIWLVVLFLSGDPKPAVQSHWLPTRAECLAEAKFISRELEATQRYRHSRVLCTSAKL